MITELKIAAQQLRAEAENLNNAAERLETILAQRSTTITKDPTITNGGAGKRKVLSIEARQRIAEAQRKRWAKQKRAA